MNSETIPPLTLAHMDPFAAEDSEPSEFRWDGRVFSLYGVETHDLLTSITIVYNDGGSKLEDENDEDLCQVIRAWARWSRHRRQAVADTRRRREGMALVEDAT